MVVEAISLPLFLTHQLPLGASSTSLRDCGSLTEYPLQISTTVIHFASIEPSSDSIEIDDRSEQNLTVMKTNGTGHLIQRDSTETGLCDPTSLYPCDQSAYSSLECGSKLKHSEEIHVVSGRTYKLLTDSSRIKLMLFIYASVHSQFYLNLYHVIEPSAHGVHLPTVFLFLTIYSASSLTVNSLPILVSAYCLLEISNSTTFSKMSSR
ncbi:uncharacterized protein LOC132396433 [Hypanus sabinus]|uniref:uncharacterized protein LOC132396433 n=1 Tax=Hypanus sabinus TaxID=79690 RepID=UPI0028C3D201|nr:uncharacterized protein LOC132396433 [Hypanus sabinus]